MEFRLLKAINDVANNKKIDAATEAVCQKGGEEMRKAGVNFEGQIQLPVDTRAAVTVATEGEDVVVTNFTNILEPLRAKNVLVQAGAKYLTGLVGDVQVPSMSASNVTWEGETAAAKDGAPTFASVKLQPKRLTAYLDISKQFLVQDSLDAEAMIRQDIVNAVNSKLEATILGSEAGTTTMPQGIFYSASALDEIVDYKDICDLEADVEDANVLGECKYVMSNKAKAALRCMARSADTTKLVMENGNIDGTEVLNTSHVEGKNVAYGDWSNLAIGQWGSLDLVIDPYTQASNGKIRLVINAFFDAKVLREDAIKVATIAD
jgi:HK97 family phage major capsid protein